ncbi:MAG TPA: hypothetical protein VMJ75_09625 [Candidatus Acidoferrales bacterium]|nr:hypothetical protein [Candidatus Acidoferrales bacterium]
MSSNRQINASRTNGALSKGPVTAEGKRRSSQNAISHGLFAKQIVLSEESEEGFRMVLNDHLRRFGGEEGVQHGVIEEMVAAWWRLRRAWAIETRMLEKEAAAQTSGDNLDRLTTAFCHLAAKPELALMHRYQTQLHLHYQRALQTVLFLHPAVQNEPNPISEHLPALEPAHPPLLEAPPDALPKPELPSDDSPFAQHPLVDGD